MSGFIASSLRTKLIALMMAVGLIPLLAVAWMALSAAGQSLETSEETKLEAINDSKARAVEDYANSIIGQIKTLSQNESTVTAMRLFGSAFYQFPFNVGASDSDIAKKRADLASYYNDEFAPKYVADNNGRSLDAQALYTDLSDEAVLLQHAYIRANEHPLGSKDALYESAEQTYYDSLHMRFHPSFRGFLQEFGYYDIFLVEPKNGQIVYSVFKELDYATSLLSGPYKDTGIAEAFRAGMALQDPNDYALIDFAQYLPSYDAPASFISSQIVDDNGSVLGVLIFQMPLDRITTVMSDTAGLGTSGESYLLGPEGLFRSDSIQNPDTHTVSAAFRAPDALTISSDSFKKAAAGESGSFMTRNYQNTSVLSAFRPVQFGNLNWVLVSDIETDEALTAVATLETQVWLLVGVAVLVILAIAWWFAGSLTAPVQALKQTMERVQKEGDFSVRATFRSRDEVGQMGEAFNSLLATLQSALGEVNTVVGAVARGDFSKQVTGDYQGALADLSGHVNTSVSSVGNTMAALGEVMDALAEGDFSKRMRQEVEGSFRERVDNAMQRTEDALTQVASVMKAVSEGRLDSRVEGHLPGQLALMQNDINESLDAMSSIFKDMAEVLGAMSNKDFTRVVDRAYSGEFDDLKESLNDTGGQLRLLVGDIQGLVRDVNGDMESLARGNEDLKARTETQAAGIQETAATMEEMTSTIDRSAESSQTMLQLAEDSRKQAEAAHQVVKEAVEAINAVAGTSQSMSEITGVIDEIAFQTNLLALNASVEAARAGEQGRGFAVVANEVRNLAQRSASAAGEIADLIKRNMGEVSSGRDKVTRTGEAFEGIIDSFGKVNEVVRDLTAALAEQSSGVRQVNDTVASMDQITQQNASLAGRHTESTRNISNKINTLANNVSQIRV